jgi:hypothetical protein
VPGVVASAEVLAQLIPDAPARAEQATTRIAAE